MAVGSFAAWRLRTRTINSQQTVKITITAIFATRSARGLLYGNLRFNSSNRLTKGSFILFHGRRVEVRTAFKVEPRTAVKAEIRREVCKDLPSMRLFKARGIPKFRPAQHGLWRTFPSELMTGFKVQITISNPVLYHRFLPFPQPTPLPKNDLLFLVGFKSKNP